MGLKRTIRLFYIFYTLYTFYIMLVSDYNVSYAFFGLVSLWLIYLFFSMGFTSVKENDFDEPTLTKTKFLFSNIMMWKPYQYILCDTTCWISTILAGKFYTSRGFIRVVSGMVNGETAYSIYQSYARTVNSHFSLAKIPYILMLTYLTVILIWSASAIIIEVASIKPIQYCHLISVFLSYLYFGIARGTNFEMYIAFVVIVYCILNRKMKSNKRISKRQVITVILLGFIVIIIFRLVLEARGIELTNAICQEINYLPERAVSKLFPVLTSLMTSIFRYLGWGSFTIGVYKYEIVLGSIEGFIANLIPFGYRTLYSRSLPDIMRNTISVGVGWVPDYMTFIDFLGLPLFLASLIILGRLGACKSKSSKMPALLVDVIDILIFIEMLSIPVGNFLAVSTPNKLTALFAFLWYLDAKLKRSRTS